ncbi:hypothetical protein [Viridibacillus arvi]|uniref:hypothetical protein n=1 Tax=Viridibacillus arvi TaxID=263475 RepID=UPI00187B8B4F|nr:hypothetical protein [Viridibacillus sp. JNUCC-6]QOV10905.1 hypothetical protein JNUCC6_20425 [Viridibacillus sp. JNUCC-6]
MNTLNATTLGIEFHVFSIENQLESVQLVTNTESTTTDIKIFTDKLYTQAKDAKNKRKYLFKRESTEVQNLLKNVLNKYINEDQDFKEVFIQKSELIAERLLTVQKDFANRYTGINPPKDGCLVILISKMEDKWNILLTKINLELFLDQDDSKYRTGLPDNNATQKSCYLEFDNIDDELTLTDIIVTDSKAKISPFWTDDFLELEEINDNQSNTFHAYNTIEKVLDTTLKKSSSGDYVKLRNSLIGYFETKSEFKLEEMVDYVIGDYQLESNNVTIETIKTKLYNLTDNKHFDTAFTIDNSRIKNKFKKTYKISEKIDLRTNSYIEDLKEIIKARTNEEGEKVLEIRNIEDNVFEMFKEESGEE